MKPIPAPVVVPQLLKRFDVKGPRYTSYPTADRFTGEFGAAMTRHWMSRIGTDPGAGKAKRRLSLYLHIPFCSAVCYFCACNRIITKERNKSAQYIKYLEREMTLRARDLGEARDVVQLHLGGGTPTFLADDELRELMSQIRRHFHLLPEGECAIEIDPRNVTSTTISVLAEIGFNRLSVGVQDFDQAVQLAINRQQTIEQTRRVFETARAAGFKSVGIDLVYGLPKQTVFGLERTFDAILELAPDRVALYNYAHLPALAKPQRRIKEEDLPSAEDKLLMLQLAIRRMTEAGHVFIGMDHFARPEDELAIAQRTGRLHRNFQGYSTWAETELIGLGVSAISQMGASYSQNQRSLPEHYEALEREELPVMRGFELNADDLLRRAIIQMLMCQFELPLRLIEAEHGIRFSDYFAAEIEEPRGMAEAGLLTINDEGIVVTPQGRLLVRVIAMVFDRYLRADRDPARYSKVI